MSRAHPWQDLITLLPPSHVSSFLRNRGYEELTQKGEWRVFESKTKDTIVLPENSNSPEYSRTISNIIDFFVNEHLEFKDILALMMWPNSDIFRYSVEDRLSPYIAIPIPFASVCIEALRSLLRFSAAGAITHRAWYTNVPPEAKIFAQSCRFAHTEPGSFTLKILCPIAPSGFMPSVKEEGLGRRTLRACVEVFRFLNKADSTNDDSLRPFTLNRNVINAIERMKPPGEFGNAKVIINFANRPLERPSEEVDIHPFAYSRARVIAKTLKKIEAQEENVFQGWITDLHKDRPDVEGSIHRAITMSVKHGKDKRTVTMSLPESLYNQAINWHEQDAEVLLRAVVDKSKSRWKVLDLLEFREVTMGQALFPFLDPSQS
jgi:hypothetical protein